MANVDNPRGLWPVRHLTGGEIKTNTYVVTTGSTVYEGDLLTAVAAGTVNASTAADGALVVGVAAHHVDDSASAGGKEIQVYDDPFIVFGIQTVSGQTPAATSVFATADHVAGSGSSTTLLSGHELNIAGTDAQLRIIGLIDRPDNSWGEHADVEVIINEHVYKAGGATI